MLRLFISIDVVGSTLFKASLPSGGEDGWLVRFQTFFNNFPIMMVGQLGMEFISEADLPRIDIWKALGDEMVFVAEPRRADELILVLRSVFKAMRRYECEYFADVPLRLKATSWVASFPEPNIEIVISEMSDGSGRGYRDFIGPDIDLGFRISHLARPSTIALSADVVELMLDAGNLEQLDIFMVGSERLKGVFHDRPYPIILARPSDEPFAFYPWEIEDCALMAATAKARPMSASMLREIVEGMRQYLFKMHGTTRPRPAF